MSRRIQREDPAYLQAMREAKELFDAAIAKNSMKGRGRPAKTAVAAPSEVIDDEIDVSDVIAEAMVETGEHEIPAPAPAAAAGKAVKIPAKAATKSPVKSPAKAAKGAKTVKASTPAKPAVKKGPAKKAAAPKKKR